MLLGALMASTSGGKEGCSVHRERPGGTASALGICFLLGAPILLVLSERSPARGTLGLIPVSHAAAAGKGSPTPGLRSFGCHQLLGKGRDCWGFGWNFF